MFSERLFKMLHIFHNYDCMVTVISSRLTLKGSDSARTQDSSIIVGVFLFFILENISLHNKVCNDKAGLQRSSSSSST